jgi:hypothetical protein
MASLIALAMAESTASLEASPEEGSANRRPGRFRRAALLRVLKPAPPD